MQHQTPKGTFDILPYGAKEEWQKAEYWQFAEEIVRETAAIYGYREIRTPIYEMSGLFDRGVGATSDIVTKEMFTFEDKGGRSVTLRPEGTSAVMRSFIENNFANLGAVHKLFYIGPMFRYERPQSGRYRQHHQFGIEAIGNPEPEQDAETIDFLCSFYRQLGLKDFHVHLNTVGDLESRNRFKDALLSHLKPLFHELSEDSQARFEKNPLRILDSKDPKDKEIVKNAPSILNYLTKSAETHFQSLCSILKTIGISYVVDDRIVRGLDYYNKTVFEVIVKELGAQNTIGAGGRFDGLISSLGGPDLAAVGFATGLERVIQTMIAQKAELIQKTRPLIYFIPLGDEALAHCFSLATQCRHASIAADVELHAKKMQSALQRAIRIGADYCAIVGSEELKKKSIQLKNLQTRQQEEISEINLLSRLKGLSNV